MLVDVISRDIALVGAELRRLGNGRTIVNQMAGRIRAALPPVRRAVRITQITQLPRRGGLNVWTARATVRASVRRGPRTAGVTLVQGRNSRFGRSDLRGLDRGRVRAPAWGNRHAWHSQTVTAGTFTRPASAAGGREFRDQVVAAVETAKREVGL